MKGYYNNILVPTDFSDQAHLALEQAFTLAKLLNIDITLLHVIPEEGFRFPFKLFSKNLTEKQREEYRESCCLRLLQAAESASKNSVIKVNPLLLSGKIVEKIIETAKNICARYIVTATNSNDPDDVKDFVSPVTSGVIKESPCPVLTINGANVRKNFDTVVLPLDLTKETRQKIIKAIEIAKHCNSTIRIVSILLTDEPEIVSRLTGQLNMVKETFEKHDVYATGKIIQGNKIIGGIANYFLDYAYETDADLIMIMKQQEISRRDKFLGANVTSLIGLSKIPVLSIIPKE